MAYFVRVRWSDEQPREGVLIPADNPILYRTQEAAEADAQWLRNVFGEELAEAEVLYIQAGGSDEQITTPQRSGFPRVH